MPEEERKKYPRRFSLPLEASDLLTYIIIGVLLILILLQSGQTEKEVEKAFTSCKEYYETRMPEHTMRLTNFTMNPTINYTGGTT